MPVQVPFPYFYPSNGSKTSHFPSSLPTSNDTKAYTNKHNTSSPENSSSPINFSSRTQNFNSDVEFQMNMESFRHRSMSNEEKSRNHGDDENVEVD